MTAPATCPQCEDIVQQHIAWLQQYIVGMTAANWQDIRLRAERQLEQLSEAVARQTRPRDFLSWAVKTFGPVAKLRSERLLRFVEEAIELAHAEGMEREVLNRVADRVYSRPPGNVGKEIGQAQACLETFAENIGLSSDREAQREFERVQEIPQEEWTRRHSAKQAIGIALPSTHVCTLEEAATRLCNELTGQNIQREMFSVGIGVDELHVYIQLPRVNCRADRIGGWNVVWHFNVGPAVAHTSPKSGGAADV